MANDKGQTADGSDADWEVAEARADVFRRQALRQVLQATDGVTARIFAMFNDLVVSAIRTGAECIDDSHIEACRPISKATPVYV